MNWCIGSISSSSSKALQRYFISMQSTDTAIYFLRIALSCENEVQIMWRVIVKRVFSVIRKTMYNNKTESSRLKGTTVNHSTMGLSAFLANLEFRHKLVSH
jgi:hypothetical protein